MDVGLMHPMEMKPEIEAEFKARQAAHEADPAHNSAPNGPDFSYQFFLPADEHTADKIKKKLDVDNPDKDNAALYTKKNADGAGSFRYDHVRIYDTARQSGNPNQPYKDIALALHDPELEDKIASTNLGQTKKSSGSQEKAAYYYPIAQMLQLKPRRNQNLAQLGLAGKHADDEDEKLDAVDVVVTEPDEVEAARRAEHLAALGVDGIDDAGASNESVLGSGSSRSWSLLYLQGFYCGQIWLVVLEGKLRRVARSIANSSRQAWTLYVS